MRHRFLLWGTFVGLCGSLASCGESAGQHGSLTVTEVKPFDPGTAAPFATAPSAVVPVSEPPATSASAPPVAPSAVAPQVCTKMGCTGGLTLPLVWGRDTLTASKYAFELTIDGKKGRCEVYFPYKSCSELRVPRCSGDIAFTLGTGCTGEGKSTADMVLGPLKLESTPAQATLKILRENVMWHQQDLTLTFAEVRPNGAGCDPVCKQASKRVCIGQCDPAQMAAAPPDLP